MLQSRMQTVVGDISHNYRRQALSNKTIEPETKIEITPGMLSIWFLEADPRIKLGLDKADSLLSSTVAELPMVYEGIDRLDKWKMFELALPHAVDPDHFILPAPRS